MGLHSATSSAVRILGVMPPRSENQRALIWEYRRVENAYGFETLSERCLFHALGDVQGRMIGQEFPELNIARPLARSQRPFAPPY